MSHRLNSSEGKSDDKNRSCLSERSTANIRETSRGKMKPYASREDRLGMKPGRQMPGLRSLSKLKRPSEKSPLTMRVGGKMNKRLVKSDEDFLDRSDQHLAEPSTTLLAQPARISVAEPSSTLIAEFPVSEDPSGEKLSESIKSEETVISGSIDEKENSFTRIPDQIKQLKEKSQSKIPEPIQKRVKERSIPTINDDNGSSQNTVADLKLPSLKCLSDESLKNAVDVLRSQPFSSTRLTKSKQVERSTTLLKSSSETEPRLKCSDSDDTSSLPSVDTADQAEMVVREITTDLIEQTITSEPEFELESSYSSPVVNDSTSFKSEISMCLLDQEQNLEDNKLEEPTNPEQLIDRPTVIEASQEQRGRSDPEMVIDDTSLVSVTEEPSEEVSDDSVEGVPVGDAPISSPAEWASQSVPHLGTTSKQVINPFTIESQKKIKVLIKHLERYQIGVDLKLSLCIAAQWSKTLYPCIKFPGKEEGKIFSEDLPTVPLIIHFLKTQPQKVASYIPQLYWLVRGPRLELLQPHEELAALQRTGLSEPTTRPSLMLRVVNDKYSAGEVRWQGVKTGSGTGFAFHPCSVEWAHTALHAGLQPAMFSPGPQGPGLYLTEDPDACLAACPPGFTWGKSRVGVQLRLALLVEFARSGVTPCAGTEGPYAGAHGDGGLLFAARGEQVRVRYLLVYVARPSRVPRAPPAVAPRPRMSIFLGFARLAAAIAVVMLGVYQAKPPSFLAHLFKQSIAPVARRVTTVWATV